MILYTPICPEEIFSNEEENKIIQVNYRGRNVCCKQHVDGGYEIVQLNSSNPQDFLDASFSPGAIFYLNDLQDFY